MFEVPEAKRVRRHELYGSEAEGDEVTQAEGDAATRAELNERLARMFSLDVKAEEAGAGESDEELPDAPAEGEDQDEPGFEFRLFSTSGSAPKVVVADEDMGDGTILSSRPKSFHLKEGFTADELERFGEVAVDYADIVRGAQQRAWGLEVPWKVTKITLTTGKKTTSTRHKGSNSEVTTEEPGKRKRPGKKRRIVLRTKEKERKVKEEEAAKHRLTKEEHLREKKKRLNREKKLKRRQKEKEKKLAGQTGAEGAGSAAGDDHSSSGSDGEDS